MAMKRLNSTCNPVMRNDHAVRDPFSGTVQNSLGNMALPSISEAFRAGDGMSQGYGPRYEGDGMSIGGVGDMNMHSGTYTHDPNRQTTRTSGARPIASSKSVFYSGNGKLKKDDVRHMLITRPICRLYYASDQAFGLHKQYKYMLHNEVGVLQCRESQVIAEFIPISPEVLMNRIVSYELCCKGSWTIFFNLLLNHAHSSIVRL